jgi:hypothetical protein
VALGAAKDLQELTASVQQVRPEDPDVSACRVQNPTCTAALRRRISAARQGARGLCMRVRHPTCLNLGPQRMHLENIHYTHAAGLASGALGVQFTCSGHRVDLCATFSRLGPCNRLVWTFL